MPDLPSVRIDEFAFVLLAGLLLIIILTVAWSSMPTEQIVLVQPSSVQLAISRGSVSNFDITINGTATQLTLQGGGEIADWLSFNKNNVQLVNSTTVTVYVTVPSTAVERVYTGTVDITGGDSKKSVQVTISVTQQSDVPHSFYVGDFIVSYDVGTDFLATKSNVEISRSYFSDSSLNFGSSVSDDKLNILTSGFIYLLVDNTNNAGNLIVDFNGIEVLNQKVYSGDMTIPINRSLIKKYNTVSVRADTPGWKFWMSTVYNLKTVKFSINYQGTSFKDYSFELSSQDVTNFKFAKLSFLVKNYKTPMSDLIITINGQQIFRGIPQIYFEKDFGREIILNTGLNTISFSSEKQTYYELENVILTVVRRA